MVGRFDQDRVSCEVRVSNCDGLCLLGTNIPFPQPVGKTNIVYQREGGQVCRDTYTRAERYWRGEVRVVSE